VARNNERIFRETVAALFSLCYGNALKIHCVLLVREKKEKAGVRPPAMLQALDSAGAAVACSDADHIVYRGDEYFPISYVAGFRSFQDRADNTLHVFCLDDHVNLRFGQEIEAVLAASVDLHNALLPALAFDFRNRHPRAELSHRVLYCVEFFPSYNGRDSFHTLTSTLFVKLPAHADVVRAHTFSSRHGELLLFRSSLRSLEPVATIVPSYPHFWDV
jgi:hypothetical protein